MDEVLLYLGTLAAIAVGGLALIILIISRGSNNRRAAPLQLRHEPRTIAPPPVQVAMSEGDEGLIWAVNGRVTRDLASVTDPTERQALAALIERVSRVQLPALPPARVEEHPVADDAIPALAVPEMPPVAEPPPAAYEDELSRPFFGRLRDSIFGVDYENKSSLRPYAAPSPVSGRGGKGKHPEAETTYGIPRFEELKTLVQQKVAQEPDAPHTTIRVGLDGLLEIVVQGHVYKHINEVPDETARRALQAAVEAWNQQE